MTASDESSPDPSPQSGFAEAKVITMVLGGVLLLLVFQTVLGRWRWGEVEIDRLPEREFEYRLDINSATPIELVHLPGIGPKLAEKIIEERQANGPFLTLGDVKRVSGIGPKLTERMAPYLRWPAGSDQ